MSEGQSVDRPRRLVRRDDDKIIAGVCSGLADHFGGDPTLFRLAFVLLGLLGFGGIVAYLVAWALIPPAGDPTRRAPQWAGPLLAVALLVLAAGIALPILAHLVNFGFPLLPGDYDLFRLEPLLVAGALVAVGVVLLRGRDDAGTRPPAETTAPAGGVTTEAGVAPTARLRPRTARRPRERSGLTPLTLAAALLIGGGATLLSNAGVLRLDVGQLAALSLLVVGAGLVVGAWFGRAWLLIAVGLLMTPLVLAASLVDFLPAGTIGSPYAYLQQAGELEDMKVLVGQATLDLTEYPFDTRQDVTLRVAAGSMTVIVPHDVRVNANVRVEGGEAFVFGGHESGFDLDVRDTAGPEDATKFLDLDIHAGFGSVGIYRLNDPDRNRRDDRGKQDEKRDEKKERRDRGRREPERREGGERRKR